MTGEDTTDPGKLKKLLESGKEERFYLVKTKALVDKFGQERSLLQYIIDNGSRMMKQREELLDLLTEKTEREYVKQTRDFDGKATESKIVNKLKEGLPSSIGLTESLKITKEKFEWSTAKATMMGVKSFFLFFLSLLFYVADVVTDCWFVLDMFADSQKNFTELRTNCTDEFYIETLAGSQFCNIETGNISACSDFHKNMTIIAKKCSEIGPRFEDTSIYKQIAIYALVHCLLHVIFMFFVLIQYGCDSGREKKTLLGRLQCIPWPPITRFVKRFLEIRKFHAQTGSNFRKDVEKRESDIAKHENAVNISSSIEATTEASPQFFFQSVYFLPILIINFWSQGWKELVSYKILSIVFSFASVAISNHFIR